MAIYGTLGESNIGDISASISDTAVDVFVYDTSKDSDGGAWRKRTQHTSWYNETLNTSTRGSRKEFPAVAVIVCTSTTVRIYDGDDPDLPMWMEFVTGGNWSHILVSTAGYIKAAEMLNGELVIARNLNTGWQLVKVSFISDTAYAYKNVAHGTGDGQWHGGIVARNGDGEYTTISTASNIVSQYNNDVAMTVLPNAPIDDATGLPVPTIAVATDGGVSVIKDDGSVANMTATLSTNNQANHISFNEEKTKLSWMTRDGAVYALVTNIPSSDVSSIQSDDIAISLHSSYNPSSGYDIKIMNGSNFNDLIHTKDNILSFAGRGLHGGLQLVDYKDVNGDNQSTNCFITTSFNSGWMHGDCKGAFLSDTDTTNVTASELITNGTFDSNVNGWVENDSTNTYSSGKMQITRTGGQGNTSYQAFTTEVGKTYVATAEINSSGSRGDFYIKDGTGWGGSLLESATGTNGQTRTLSATFTATSTTTSFGFNVDTISTSIIVDNVSVRLADQDRSVNTKGLQVFGTVTKSPVATGADLVGYSGWSASNYLRQPYNSDLNFGTGDFCIMGWMKTSTGGRLINIQSASGYINIQAYNSNRIQIDTSGLGYITGTLLTGTLPVWTSTWNQFVVVKRGDLLSLYINNQLDTSVNAASLNMNDPDAVTTIGLDYTLVQPFNGSLALFRILASAPSEEQIKKMYEDERMLFQENVKCTLHGSSNDVTALGYDDSTNLLHVGTSSGRSDFQGMRRINNTTTAVTTAISASNGLVAEQ